ncbi:hypothetical protein [Microcystis aeruginosa]|uniref:hypothetical protein n=1 Tax=Microcystis aeruginosa TaxID=1126 RepID=UPI0018804225|nr:hypothetical protein [Microcystis aeruginosa]MBE8994146.1 hypothetical protein [Microcystis aeruginosa LEGE 91341]
MRSYCPIGYLLVGFHPQPILCYAFLEKYGGGLQPTFKINEQLFGQFVEFLTLESDILTKKTVKYNGFLSDRLVI